MENAEIGMAAAISSQENGIAFNRPTPNRKTGFRAPSSYLVFAIPTAVR